MKPCKHVILMDVGKTYIVKRLTSDPDNLFIIDEEYLCYVDSFTEHLDCVTLCIRDGYDDLKGLWTLDEFFNDFTVLGESHEIHNTNCKE